jgi:hypothetical protein
VERRENPDRPMKRMEFLSKKVLEKGIEFPVKNRERKV